MKLPELGDFDERNLAIAAVLALGVVALIFLSSSETGTKTGPMITSGASCESVSEKETHRVAFTGSNFNPRTVQIERCDTVIWQDNSSDPGPNMWIASNDHPTHKKYDGTSRSQHCGSVKSSFDQCSQGENYSFTFDKTGTWRYHNHQPYVTGGRVVVE